MSFYQSPEAKKEEFRKYLQRSGAIDSLTTALVRLYESEKPTESTEFIQKHLGDGRKQIGSKIMEDYQQQLKKNEALEKENNDLKKKMSEMAKVIETLKKNLNHSRGQARKVKHQEK